MSFLSSLSKSTDSVSTRDSEDSEGSIDVSGDTSETEIHEIVSHRPDVTERLAVEIAEGDLPHRPGYEWASSQVTHHFSKYRCSYMVDSFVSNVAMLFNCASKGDLTIERCIAIDNVCYGREGHRTYFFYMYACLFTDSHVRLPFDKFTMDVLRILNVAPTQLHPNTWASLQGFRLLAEMFRLKPSPHVYLHYFSSRPASPVRWLSLISQSKAVLFSPFASSYKYFKNAFFKISIEPTGRHHFFDGDTLSFPCIGPKILFVITLGQGRPRLRMTKKCLTY